MIDIQEWSGADVRRESPVSRILVVDDEPAIRQLIRRLLVEHGYHVNEAGDGHQALEMVRAAPHRVDLVVSDLHMPRVNGIQLLQTLSVECPTLPVVMISAYAADDLQKFGIVAPCGVLSKPLVEPVFLAEVARCLAQRN